jgi:predicted DNA-binding transcriptional regulator YafY
MISCYDLFMQASRLLSILMLLQARGRMSASALATELEVSYRTILRDMDQLSAAGVPVWADRGRDGGFQLRKDWSTTLTGLTEGEAQALLLAGLPGTATDLGLGQASASARLKVLASVPDALKTNAARVSERLHIDPIDWYRSASPPSHLQAVADAVWNQRWIAIRYDSWTKISDCELMPLGLVLKAGVWYMVATSETKIEPRTFRLSNVQKLTTIERSFEYPKSFVLSDFWQTSTRRFESEIYTLTATLRVNKIGLRNLTALTARIRDVVEQSMPSSFDEGGWMQVSMPIESIDHGTNQLLGLGSDAMVITPLELRESIRARIEKLTAMYSLKPSRK